MLKYQKSKRVLSLVMSIFLLIGCFVPKVLSQDKVYASQKEDINIHAKHELGREAINKIEAQVMEDFEREEFVELMVYMKSQVDTEMVAYKSQMALSSARMTPYQAKLQVRRNVVEALKSNMETSQVNVINYLNSEKGKGNVEEFESYSIVNMLYVKATKEVAENLAYMGEVEKIYKNKIHTLDSLEIDYTTNPIAYDQSSAEADLESNTDNQFAAGGAVEWHVSQIRADEVWELGYDGTGVVVGVIDSGVDWTHPTLKNKWRGYNPVTGMTSSGGNWLDTVKNTTLPEDSGRHGTHVTGIILGQCPDGTNKIGVAPGAKWIAARVFDAAGFTSDSKLLSAADWMLHPGGNPDNAPDIVNNSWGGGAGINDWYRNAVRAWRAAGIVPVFAAGNTKAGEPLPVPGSISVPSNYPESIAVAAINSDNKLAYFSKLGPSPYDETMIKPNLSAPGVSVRSSIPDGRYVLMDGTSMATPAVSGALALVLSTNVSLNVDELQELLQNTATGLTDNKYPTSPNMGYGYGIVDVFEAVSSVSSGTGYIAGGVFAQDDNSSEINIAVGDAVVTIKETGRSIKVDPITGEFSMRVTTGTYTLVAEAYGYYTMEQTVEVAENSTANANFILESKPKGTIVGKVSDRFYDTPAPYAVIRVVEDPKISSVTADENGNFVINNVYEGEYTLKISANHFESGETSVIVVGNETINIEIGLKRFVGFDGEIVYDDGTAENALTMSESGYGVAVRFTPLQYGKVKGANVYIWNSAWPKPGGNRIGFVIYGINEIGETYQVGEPIFQNIVRGQWNFIDLSSFLFETDRDFYISTIQDAGGTQCPGISLDTNSPYGDRSYYNLSGVFELISEDGFEGGFMIRARMEYAVDIPVITNLEDINYTIQDTIAVEGELSTDAIVNIYVNNQKISSVSSVNKIFTAQVSLQAGENIIRVTAELNGIETEPSEPVVVIRNMVNILPMADLSTNSVIIGDEAYDIEYLNNNAAAQAKLIDWFNIGGTVFVKINRNDIVTSEGQQVSIDVLPNFLTYFDANGEVRYYKK